MNHNRRYSRITDGADDKHERYNIWTVDYTLAKEITTIAFGVVSQSLIFSFKQKSDINFHITCRLVFSINRLG